jgi:high frequency lysogenization protein
MTKSLNDRTLALAGMVQAAWLVSQVAHTGGAPASIMSHSLRSILQLNPPDVPSIYGGIGGVATGLRELVKRLGGDRNAVDADMDTTRYTLSLMHLERKLSRRDDLLRGLRDGIGIIAARHADEASTTDAMTDACAELYSHTLSTLTPRIMVKGDPAQLNSAGIPGKIRALLLAGMRSAVLWRQCGGRRWQLLLRRGDLLTQARQLLKGLPVDINDT